MKILIVYGTTEGQTRKIARYMEDRLQGEGHAVTLSDASDEPPAPEGFDAVVLGGSLHMMKHQAALEHYARTHAGTLNRMPGIFYSVSLGIASGEESSIAEAGRIAREFVDSVGWEPRHIELVAGALKYTQYDFFKRFMLKMISKRAGGDTDTSRDHEYTNWQRIDALCGELVALAGRERMVEGNA
jgi:menaquinone-dependent protoporphyrinogen oxidase